MWGGTGTGSMFQNQWSPGEEKQVRNKGKEMQEMTKRGKETYPEATGLCFLGRGMPTFFLLVFSTGSG
jgi:hypothetical protein